MLVADQTGEISQLFSKFSVYKHLDLFSVVELVCNAFK